MPFAIRTPLLRAIVELLEFHEIRDIHLPVTEKMLWDGLMCALVEDQAKAGAAKSEAREMQNAEAYEN